MPPQTHATRSYVFSASAFICVHLWFPLAPPKLARAADVLVHNNSELISAIDAAHPGDSIVLRNGIWTNISLANHLIPTATAAAPINIRAQTPGQVFITGPSTIFDVRGSHYSVSGLRFQDTNDTLKALRFRGDNARVYDNLVLNFGRYNQILWDVQDTAANPTSSFDHNFLAGKKDRGVSIVLDGSLNAQIKNNFFGQRDRGGPSGQTNGWETIRIGNSNISAQTLGAVIQNNYFEATEGEEEIVSDKTQNNFILNNTFQNITKGRVTARLGGGGLYEGNYFLNALGFRVGNADDTIPDHPGLVIRNNYLEGPNAKIILPGYQTSPTIENNTVYVTSGAYVSGEGTTGKYPLEYHNTTGGVLNNNVLAINDAS
jgi:poly(beta-D-mannuronate) lyase